MDEGVNEVKKDQKGNYCADYISSRISSRCCCCCCCWANYHQRCYECIHSVNYMNTKLGRNLYTFYKDLQPGVKIL